MGIKERRQRQRDDTKLRIISAALKIGKEEGWNALSMRKIGDVIEYSAPMVYEYFDNKEALLLELTRIGYGRLVKELQAERKKFGKPTEQIKAMWLVYWRFAFKEKELYQLMFGIEISCCTQGIQIPEAEVPEAMISETIAQMINDPGNNSDRISRIYYTLWSAVHGLISLNMIGHNAPADINGQVLDDTLNGIINSISTN